MAEIRNQTLSGDIAIDGQVFINCEFKDARLLFDGGTPPNFDNCRFTNSRFGFQSEAANTLNFLRAMLPHQSNMRQVVFGLMPELNEN